MNAADFLSGLSARGLSARTVAVKGQRLGYFWEYARVRGVEDARDLTRELVGEYAAAARERRRAGRAGPVSGEEWAERMRVVKQYLDCLVEGGELLWNPCPAVPARRRTWTPRTVLTEEEVGRILAGPDVRTQFGLRDRAVLELLYATGLRRSELTNLDIYDVESAEGVVRVRGGKGGKDRVVPLGRTAGEWGNVKFLGVKVAERMM